MRDYGKVFTKIWESADFRALSEDGRSLVLYLLTCQHGTIAGVFRVPDGYACEDLQWTSERVSEGFANVAAKGFATRCEVTKWVWVSKFLEWNPPENPNQRKAAAKIAQGVPDECAWKLDFIRVCGPSIGLEPTPSTPPTLTVVEPFANPSLISSSSSSSSSSKNPSGSTPVKPARQPRGAKFAPGDFEVTAELQAWAEQNAPGVDWLRETEKFRDWEFKHARTDWSKVWRTWMRKAQEGAGSGKPPGQSLLAGAV
jgi:hypothetical protein